MIIYFLFILFFSNIGQLFSDYESLVQANQIFQTQLLPAAYKYSLVSEGFAADTLVQQSDSYVSIQNLQNNDSIFGIYDQSQKVILIQSKQLLVWYEIELENGLILQAAPAQKLYDGIDQTFKEINNLELWDHVHRYKILKITKKEEFKKFYQITTSDHLFVLQGDILVHNVDVSQAFASTIQISSFILKHPVVTAVGRTVSVAKLAFFLYALVSDAQERTDRLLQALENEEIIKETRSYYQARHKQLFDVLLEYQDIEQAMVVLAKHASINTALFVSRQYQSCNTVHLLPALSVELSYSLEQRKTLLELRENSLKDLENKIIDIQISLILQLEDYYKKFNKNIDDLCFVYKNAEAYCQQFDNSKRYFTSDLAYKAVYSIKRTQEILETLLQQTVGFKLLHQYYLSSHNAIALKNSTNIQDIFLDMYGYILSYENKFIALEPILINIAHDMQTYFLFSGLLQQSHINGILYNLQKERESKNIQETAELLAKKVNIQFPQPPDDPEDKDKYKTKKFDKEIYQHNLNEISENTQDVIHMFRDKTGKLKDTIENRKRILDLVKDKRNCYGQDQRGVVWYAKLESDGSQLWAEVNPINYRVRNCGFNVTSRDWNPLTGFKMQSFK
jgi:hypothetical protein